MRKVSRKNILLVMMLLAVAVVSVLALRPSRGSNTAGDAVRADSVSAHEAPVILDHGSREQPSDEASSSSVWTDEASCESVDNIVEATSETADSTREASEAQPDERTFVMPAGASYEPEVALITLAEGVSIDEVNVLLEQTDAVKTKHVSEEDLARGYLELELVEGASVEDSVNQLLASDAVDIAQPNFCYYPQTGDEGDLRALLADELAPASNPDGGTGPDEVEEGPGGETDATEESFSEVTSHEPLESSDDESRSAAESSETPADTLPDEELPSGEEVPSAPDAEDPEPADDDASLAPSASDLKDLLNDPYSEEGKDSSWNLSSINAYAAWSVARCEGSVAVAIFDEHPSYEHEDLSANVLDVYDATTGADTYATSSFDRHGTHVAGIVGAVANNNKGLAGVSYNAKLVMVNVQNASEAITSTSIRDGYTYIKNKADELGVRIVNLSISGPSDSPVSADKMLATSIREAYERDIITVVAAGNTPIKTTVKDANGNPVSKTFTAPYYSYPGDVEQAVSVMSLEEDDGSVTLCSTSNFNVADQRDKNISAPGQGIYSTIGSSGYDTLSGTSMAAPHVTGVLALEFAANPNLTAQEAVSVLYATARDLGEVGWDETYGYGEIDAWRAVTTAADPEAVAAINTDEPSTPEVPDAPMPTVTGASKIPVNATATYRVSNGSLKLKSGTAATLSDKTLTAVKAGTVTLAVLDVAGVERKVVTVQVYPLTGWWRLSPSTNAKLALNVKGGYVANSANINLATASGARHQAWRFEEQENGSYVIRNAKSGKLVHVAWGSPRHGANIIQYPQSDVLWQQWSMEVDADNSVSFSSDDSGLMLGVAGAAKDGTNVVQQDPTGAVSQKWQLTRVTVDVGPIWDGVYKVSSSLNTKFVLEVAKSSKATGANVQLGKSTKKTNQKWLFTYLGNGVYKVRPMCSTKVLMVSRGKKTAGTNVLQGNWRKAGWQKWTVVANKDGSCSIRRSGTTLVLAAQGTKAKAGLNVCQAKLSSKAKSQKWWLSQY